MKLRTLGASGPAVSELGLGCNNFGARISKEASQSVVLAALELGITLFDTADVYGGGESERLLGEVLQEGRADVVIATKFGWPMPGHDPDEPRGRPEYIERAVDGSLRRLMVETIDLYQIHQPDPSTPIAETVGFLGELVRRGKIRWFGCSNFAAWQIADLWWTAQAGGIVAPISAQNEFNLLSSGVEVSLFPALNRYGMGLLPYYPLARGLLTGKYRSGQKPPAGSRLARVDAPPHALDLRRLRTVDAIRGFATERQLSLVAVAIAGLLRHSEVASVISGATSRAQVVENVAAGQVEVAGGDWDVLRRLIDEASLED
ncbi:MAG: aldo/keto reductase [Candidatus Dormiibacterota bacterium]